MYPDSGVTPLTTSAYGRLRFLWGALDITVRASDTSYSPAQTGPSLGPSAVASVGVGVRRATLVFDRSAAVAGADAAETHIDFLNLTGGVPDDTWIDSDYATVEGLILAFWASLKGHTSSSYKLATIDWYRHGYGIVPPNPVQRVTTVNTAGTISSQMCPPQNANTFTLRTGSRRHWGRLYWPCLMVSDLAADGSMNPAVVDILNGDMNTLVTNAFAAQFPVVVTSLSEAAVFNVEHVEVDSNTDIQRRRRWKSTAHKSILP